MKLLVLLKQVSSLRPSKIRKSLRLCRFFTNSWHPTSRARHKQRISRILRKLFAIGISMQNESRLYREMVHNGKSRPTFDLYSSLSANPRKLPLRQLANPFACYPSAELLMFGIVQNLAQLTREWRPFVFHMRGENGANRTKSLKTSET